MKYHGYNPGTVDGVFGRNSKAAAKRFQEIYDDACRGSLDEDGVVGEETWPRLRRLSC
ncbi:peptidoglycan-binding domain-containing protein [Streptomyces europaeiscabiei]|uniref:peptidoglycan-binding domain-containing protein n=1 Tax=Streptomyces europaeiscabiei TaxID=146819 RepID=UPI00399AB8A5